MPEIVVLGPTGNVGSALLRLLQERGISARTGNRQDFDYTRPDTFMPLLKGATHLFLLTPVVDTMVSLTGALLEAAVRAGIGKVVRLSAFGAREDSPVRILRWHAQCEALVRASPLATAILRPNAFMQNFIQFQGRSIREKSLLAVPAGKARMAFIDASDVARVALHALLDDRFDGENLELSGPEAVSFEEAAKALSVALGRSISYVDVPEARTREALAAAKVPSWRIDALLELYESHRRKEAEAVTHTVEAVTGIPPRSIDGFFIQHQKELR